MNTRWWDLLIGVLFGLLSAGLVLLVSKPRTGTAILLKPPPTQVPIVVDIDGAVSIPGVYALPLHSRVIDAVEAAGGFTDQASQGSVNLAAILEDGTQIYIPSLNPGNPETAGLKGEVLSLSAEGELISLVNINQADREALMALPGIGPVTADKIITYREEHAFARIEEIQKVSGIGPSTYEQIKPYLTIGE
jgi:competence protein ComEA